MPSATTSNKDLLGRIRKCLAEFGVTADGGPVVVAVSGGPDSVALSHLLHTLGLNICLAHLNHGLRGKEADADQAFVADLASRLGVPFETQTIHLAEVQANLGGNLQSLARQLRYRFLQQVAEHHGARWIATGHTLNDQVETLLLSLIRGAGRRGLSGMPAMRLLGKQTLIRPLLDVRRGQLLDYLQTQGYLYRVDSSNLSLRYRRNQLRLEVLPLLKRLNPRLMSVLGQTSRFLRDEESLLDNLTRMALVEARQVTPGEASTETGQILWRGSFCKLSALHPALMRRAAMRLVTQCVGHKKHLPLARQAEAIVQNIRGERPQWDLRLAEGLLLARRYDQLLVIRESTEEREEVFRLPDKGEVEIPPLGARVLIEVLPRPEDIRSLFSTPEVQTGHAVYLDADQIAEPLHIRCRRPGDRMPVLGGGGSRKVKKLMSEARMTREQRRQPRLVVCGNDIVWLIGCGISERYKVTEQTRRLLKLQVIGI